MLRSLEICNFKSYTKPTFIEFKKFSAILGPNGCGKSTLVESLSFLFNPESFFDDVKNDDHMMQKIREELYNRASEQYESAESGDSNLWVQATFCQDDEILQVYRVEANFESNSIVYMINNKESDLREYQRSLSKFNIDRNFNNFLVFQDKVLNFASLGSGERTHLLECISGSVSHKYEYESLKRSINELKQLEHQLRNKKVHLSKEIKNIKILNSAVEEHKILQTELSEKETQFYSLKIFQLQKAMEQLFESLKKKEQRLSTNQDKVQNRKEFDQQKKKIQARLFDIETKIRDVQVTILDDKNVLAELNGHIDHHKKKLCTAKKTLKEAKNCLEQNRRNIDELKKDLEKVKLNRSEFKDKKKKIKLKDKDRQKFDHLELEFEMKVSNHNVKLDKLNRESQMIEARLEGIYQKIERKFNKIDANKNEWREINEEEKKVLKQIEDLDKQCREIDEKINSYEQEKDKISEIVPEIMRKIELLQLKINDYDLSEQEKRILLKKQEILKKLKNKFSGVRNRLFDLYNIPEMYEIPFKKLLGKNFNGIIVDDTKTARLCIEFLKNEYKGSKFHVVETFIPMDYTDKSKEKKLQIIKLRKLADQSNTFLAFDVIAELNCDQDIKRYLQTFYGDVLICKTDDIAQELAYPDNNFKNWRDCVSFDGTYYKKSGLISGGREELARKASLASISTVEQLKEEKENLHGMVQDNTKKLLNIRVESDNLKDEGDILNNRLNLMRKQHNAILSKKQNIKTDLVKLQNDIETLQTIQEKKDLESEMVRLNTQIKLLQEKVESIKSNVFADFCRKFGLTDISEFIDGDLSQDLAYQKEILQHDQLIYNIEEQISSLQNSDTNTKIERWTINVSNIEKKLNELETKKSILEKALIEKNENLEKLELEQTKYEDSLERLNEQFGALNQNRKLRAERSEIKSKIRKLQDDRAKILKQCKIEGINLALISQEESSSSEDSELIIDVEYLQANVDLGEIDELDTLFDKLGEEINSLKEQIEKLPPAPKSSSNVKSLQKKLDAVKSEHQQILANLKKSTTDFENVKSLRSEKFTNALSLIDEHVDAIYKKLYKSDQAQATIIPNNSEEPYLDGIQFSCIVPRKKYTNIENLSGGEQTVASLAFLFAIHRVKPTPFIVLDEVDAALDRACQANLIDYFLDLSRTVQIIIISHNMKLNSFCQALIGLTMKKSGIVQSEVFHFNLEPFHRNFDSSNMELPSVSRIDYSSHQRESSSYLY